MDILVGVEITCVDVHDQVLKDGNVYGERARVTESLHTPLTNLHRGMNKNH